MNAPAKKLNPFVRLKPESRKKLDRLAKQRRWKLGETIDAGLDALIAEKAEQPTRRPSRA
jgi:hypothetical protein